MKRNLIVAALATLGTSAVLAQSSVTLYGRLNTTVERQKLGGVSSSGVFNNASRIGFTGVEDLGGGLKAGFQLEHRFNSDTGAQSASAFWGGAGVSEVNLGGDFGTIRLGHFTSEAYYATADYISMHNHDTGSSADAFYAYRALTVRDDDRVSYRSPTLGGFVIHLGASANDGAPGGDRGYDAAATYNVGPIQFGAGYTKLGDAKTYALRVNAELGGFVIGGYVQRDTDAWTDFGPDFAGNRTTYRLAAMYTLGASEFHANIGRANDIGDTSNTDATQWTLAYNYNLSKRTKVYGYYTRISGDGAPIYTGGSGDGKFSSFALGVRHNF